MSSPINFIGGLTYALALTDKDKLLICQNSGGCSITIPSSGVVPFPISTHIDILSWTSGTVSFTWSGVAITVLSNGSKLKVNGSETGVSLINYATDSWVLIGNLSS